MSYSIELRGEHGERIFLGRTKQGESIHDVIARVNRMKEALEAPDRVDKPVIYVPGGWLSESEGS